MCGCVRHSQFEGRCTCSCPEHAIIREAQEEKKEPRFDFSINLFDLSENKLAEVRDAVEAAISTTDDISYSSTNREIYDD